MDLETGDRAHHLSPGTTFRNCSSSGSDLLAIFRPHSLQLLREDNVIEHLLTEGGSRKSELFMARTASDNEAGKA